MDIKKIMEIISEFVDENGVIDLEGVQEKIEEVIQDDEGKNNSDKQDNQQDEEKPLSIDDVAKMSKDEIKGNVDAIRKLLISLSQDEVNEHWDILQVVLQEVGA